MDLITAFFCLVGALRLGWFPPHTATSNFLQQSANKVWLANIPHKALGKLFQTDEGLPSKKNSIWYPQPSTPSFQVTFWWFFRSPSSPETLVQLTLRPSFWPPETSVFFWRKNRVTGWPWASHGTLCLWSEFHARMAASDGGRKLKSTRWKKGELNWRFEELLRFWDLMYLKRSICMYIEIWDDILITDLMNNIYIYIDTYIHIC